MFCVVANCEVCGGSSNAAYLSASNQSVRRCQETNAYFQVHSLAVFSYLALSALYRSAMLVATSVLGSVRSEQMESITGMDFS